MDNPRPASPPKQPTSLKSSNPALPPRMTYEQRVNIYLAATDQPVLDIPHIRKLASAGVPDPLRAFYWKVLLGYLPANSSIWPEELAKMRNNYAHWHADLIVNPRKAQEAAVAAAKAKEEEEQEGMVEVLDECDHPLSNAQSSQWNEFFKDNEMLFEIEKDVQRTFPHLHFFQISHEAFDEKELAHKSNRLAGRDVRVTQTKESMQNPHYQALRSILFMWAKLNPGIAYVQGMNEVLGPIYYIFATSSNEDTKNNAEADAFFCFNNLMSEIMNNFCKTLDSSQFGIKGQIKELNQLLKQKDPELWHHLEKQQLDPQYYSFRWLTLLLSQEFELPDILRLWDSLFADSKRFHLLLLVCVAMLIQHREKLLGYQFADALKLLQKYPPIDITVILSLADQLSDPNYKASDYEIPEEKPLTIEGSSPDASGPASVVGAIFNAFSSFALSRSENKTHK